MSRWAAWAVALCLVVAGTPCEAFAKGGQAKVSKADKKRRKKVVKVVQKYVELGESLFHAGDHAEAAKVFGKAEQALAEAGLAVPAGLHRSVARCHDQAGQVTLAVAAYTRFLEAVDRDDEKMARRIKEAEDDLGRLQGVVGRTALTFDVRPAGAAITVDGEQVELGDDGKLPVAPGAHKVKVTARGHKPVDLEIEVSAGAAVPVVARLTPTSPVAPVAAASDGQEREADPASAPPGSESASASASEPEAGGAGWVPWALAAGGASLGLGALVMQGSAVSSASKAESRADEGDPDGEVDDLHGEAVTAQFMALGLGLTSVGLLGGAAWLWLGGADAVAALRPTPWGLQLDARF